MRAQSPDIPPWDVEICQRAVRDRPKRRDLRDLPLRGPRCLASSPGPRRKSGSVALKLSGSRDPETRSLTTRGSPFYPFSLTFGRFRGVTAPHSSRRSNGPRPDSFRSALAPGLYTQRLAWLKDIGTCVGRPTGAWRVPTDSKSLTPSILMMTRAAYVICAALIASGVLLLTVGLLYPPASTCSLPAGQTCANTGPPVHSGFILIGAFVVIVGVLVGGLTYASHRNRTLGNPATRGPVQADEGRESANR
jgi:hypothetical protein